LYHIEFLPIAKKDMVDIVQYISHTLQNPQAANTIMEHFSKGIEMIQSFPYANPVYSPIMPLKHEYRKMLIGSYLMFYWVDEQQKSVTITRVIYASRDYKSLLR